VKENAYTSVIDSVMTPPIASAFPNHFTNFVKKLVLGGFVAVILTVPTVALAAEDLRVAGWIPWWQDTAGIKSATRHLDRLDTVYPFAFEVAPDGTLVDKANLRESQWRTFIRAARRAEVEVIPTVMWFDGPQIHAVLSDPRRRANHVAEIVRMVEQGRYDGVNIDYEKKLAETIDHFSAFLRELSVALQGRLLTCAIEARTPPQDLFRVIPNPLLYANDYREIARHCDRIELMTYDQQRADLTLNRARQGLPYMPVADDEWVKKVLDLALRDFPKDKVYLGIPTYGRVWDVTVAPQWYRDYTLVATPNVPRLRELAQEYRVRIGRSVGGDAVISYFPKGSPHESLARQSTPRGTPRGYESAAKALAHANRTGREVTVRFASFSDATTAERRLKIAQDAGVAGVAFFKIDGEEDQKIWPLLK
jgi:spore germination protein YaaH